MKLKCLPEDFIVDEICDEKSFSEKNEGKDYFYFKLIKTNYSQMRAVEVISRAFNTSKKFIHFAGNKDKVGITSQIISLFGIKEEDMSKHVYYVNDEIKDISIKYIGKFSGRINLGDNLGNKFQIVVRDLSKNEVEYAKSKVVEISKNGAINFFDSQRFGFANNSHLIGRFILRNEIELAVKEILTSLPNNPSDDLREFVELVNDKWEFVREQNVEIIEKLINCCPDKFREYKAILRHLIKAKNDFPGAFRTIHKKIRTLYLHAYQSYIFNETAKKLKEIGKLDKYTSLELINPESEFDSIIKPIVSKLLDKDEITVDLYRLKHMPELVAKTVVYRDTLVFPKKLEIISEDSDELFEGKTKIIVTFELSSGQYATNIVSQLFV